MPGPLGARLPRLEDPRLVQGRACYTGDVKLPGMLYVAFARSPHAHARLTGLRFSAARAVPGVVTAFGAYDLPALARPLPPTVSSPDAQTRMPSLLATDLVRHTGEAIAVVVATDRYAAADGMAAIEATYEPLPVMIDPERALDEGAILVHADVPGNAAARLRKAIGDVESAFAGADVLLRERFSAARAAGAAIEPRVVVAQPGGEGTVDVTLWNATQAPHTVRHGVAEALGLEPNNVRVIAPDVGGAFGPKGRLYAEEAVLAVLALELGRPVIWEASRNEDFLTTYQGRGLIADVELAALADGTLVGLRASILQDCGAYLPTGLTVPQNAAQHLLGPYRIPAYAADITAVYTHKAPLTPLRGGGRELGVFVMERILDHLARRLGRDPIDLRQQNALRPDEFPYDTGFPARSGGDTVVYDSGDYPAYLRRARELIAYDDIRRAQPEERRAGRFRGVAVTAFLEATGMGEETAHVEVTADGTVRVTVGSPSNGQSHATTFAQVCAERLGVPVERIHVVSGDTQALPVGNGTLASRMAVMGGNAVALAARELRERVLLGAAEVLAAPISDLDLDGSGVRVRSAPGRCIDLPELARRMAGCGDDRRLSVMHCFAPERAVCFAGGAHAAVVEVDVETGQVQVQRYAVVHDCGTAINPQVVEGQIQGGIAHGLGNALYEIMAYDGEGQLQTGTLLDYALPRAEWCPTVMIEHREQPTPNNPEGIKGAGEGGTIGALATIVGAVEDALAPLAPALNSLPLRSEDIARLCRPLIDGGECDMSVRQT